jgi:hypothetical protein
MFSPCPLLPTPRYLRHCPRIVAAALVTGWSKASGAIRLVWRQTTTTIPFQILSLVLLVVWSTHASMKACNIADGPCAQTAACSSCTRAVVFSIISLQVCNIIPIRLSYSTGHTAPASAIISAPLRLRYISCCIVRYYHTAQVIVRMVTSFL